MRVHWEKLGILGPVYRLVGKGFSDNDIAGKLNISEDNVRRCIAWLLRFGSHDGRGGIDSGCRTCIEPRELKAGVRGS
jgi:hypothetical protein